MSWGQRLLTITVALAGVLFVVMGLRWLVDPAGAAPSLGMKLDSGFGLSSQIADVSAFFIVAGLCILIAVATRARTWFYPPMMLMLAAAAGRLVAWVVHDAALVPGTIAFELIVAALLFVGSRTLPQST